MTVELQTEEGTATREIDGWSLTPAGTLILQIGTPEGQLPEFYASGYWKRFKQVTPIQTPEQQQIIVPKLETRNLKLT